MRCCHTVAPASGLKGIGREAGAAVGQHVGDLEGQGSEGLVEEGDGRGRGLVVLDGEVNVARGAVDDDVEIPLAGSTIAIAELGQVLHVDMDEADLVVCKDAVRLAALVRWRQAVEALRLEDAVDRVPVQVRQEVGDDEGEVVEGEAGGRGARRRRWRAPPRLPSRAAYGAAPSGPGNRRARACATYEWSRWRRRSARASALDPSRERAISARTAGVVRALGWIESISEPSWARRAGATHQSAKPAPRSTNEPDPNNVPLPNSHSLVEGQLAAGEPQQLAPAALAPFGP